jgi:DNA-directed RNA polymerase subunit RPC12/RpoP
MRVKQAVHKCDLCGSEMEAIQKQDYTLTTNGRPPQVIELCHTCTRDVETNPDVRRKWYMKIFGKK